MSKKIRITGIIIISILLIILISMIIYNIVYLPSTRDDKQQPTSESTHLNLDYKTLDICKEGIECGYGTREYDTITTDINSEVLNNIISELNTKINNYYIKSLNATDMNSTECIAVSNLYQRSIMTQSRLTLYDSDNILGFTLISGETNLCTSVANEDLEVYVYDVMNDKVLTEDDIKSKYGISNDEITDAIGNSIKQMNIDESKTYTTNITDYNLYIETDGTIGVYYKQTEDNIYYNVLLNKHI